MDKKDEPQANQIEIEEEEEEDLFNKRIENSGCSKQHYELQVYESSFCDNVYMKCSKETLCSC